VGVGGLLLLEERALFARREVSPRSASIKGYRRRQEERAGEEKLDRGEITVHMVKATDVPF
jgi:hypothetical protein